MHGYETTKKGKTGGGGENGEGRERSTQSKVRNLREEVNSIAALLDALLPVFHEVAQGEQGIITDGDLVFRGPGFHGHQDDASVELLLIDLVSSEGKWRAGINTRAEADTR